VKAKNFVRCCSAVIEGLWGVRSTKEIQTSGFDDHTTSYVRTHIHALVHTLIDPFLKQNFVCVCMYVRMYVCMYLLGVSGEIFGKLRANIYFYGGISGIHV
jgi:hypothetical protein